VHHVVESEISLFNVVVVVVVVVWIVVELISYLITIIRTKAYIY
jgi:uncharacterized membrane protein YqiK